MPIRVREVAAVEERVACVVQGREQLECFVEVVPDVARWFLAHTNSSAAVDAA
jgi:hypothetical protein